MTGPLYRTIIHIWTQYNPEDWELEDLARDAVDGAAYCDYQFSELIDSPVAAGLKTEFFDEPGEED